AVVEGPCGAGEGMRFAVKFVTHQPVGGGRQVWFDAFRWQVKHFDDVAAQVPGQAAGKGVAQGRELFGNVENPAVDPVPALVEGEVLHVDHLGEGAVEGVPDGDTASFEGGECVVGHRNEEHTAGNVEDAFDVVDELVCLL